jgi:hypothetical protein
MNKKRKKHQPRNIDVSINRANQVKDGFFDGRFAPKLIPNKKRALNRLLARTKVKI